MPDTVKGSSTRGQQFVIIVTVVAALGGLLFGYDTGVISGAILFIRQQYSLSTVMTEWVTSIVLAGAIIGAALGGFIADRFGRRYTIMSAAIVFLIGAIETAFAPSITWLLIGRSIIGVAIGIASFVSPLYISEVAPKHLRGSLVAVNQVALTSGIVLAYLVDYLFASSAGWRWMFGLAAIPAAVLGIGMWRMPNSPRWLIMRGKHQQAVAVLQQIRDTREDVHDEAHDIQQSLAQQGGHWQLLLQPSIRPALIVGLGLAIFQQITGINTVIYYAPMIFQLAGIITPSTAILATADVGVINVLFTVIAMLLLDRVGRRPLLLTGLVGMTLGLVALGLAFALPVSPQTRGWLAAGSLMLYVAAFAVGLGPVFWLLISEIYPLRIRGIAMSLATVVNWGFNLIVTLTFLSLIQVLGRAGIFWAYAAFGIVAWFFAYFLVPETKGRTLEEIEAHWQAGKHPRELR